MAIEPIINNIPEFLGFGGVKIPQATESQNTSNDRPTTWGTNNNFPFFLLSLFSKSPIHANIINQKAVHIWGDGLMNIGDKKPFQLKPNVDDNLNSFVDKILKSYLIFNAIAVEVNFNIDGSVGSYVHIPIERVGLSPSKDKIFYYGDKDRQKVTYTYQRYNPALKYSDNNSKVFYFERYVPTVIEGKSTTIVNMTKVYPTPDYHALYKTLLTDIAITDFNYNQISNHFSPATLISFFNGNQNEDVKAKIIRDLKDGYTGADGQKLMIDFNHPNGKGAEIKPLTAGDWADCYNTVSDAVQATIYKGHEITSSALFGEAKEGSLGSTQELENAYEIWNNGYLRVRRTEVETVLSELFNAPIYFQNKPLFSATISDAIRIGIYTINELRAEQGKEPIADGDRFIASAVKANNAPTSSFKQEHQCSIKCANEEVTSKYLTAEDFDLVKDMGASWDDFDLVEGDVFSAQCRFDDESDIAEFILNNDITGVSSAELRALIKKELSIDITTAGLKKLITDLSNAGVISATFDNGKFIIKPPVADTKKELAQREIMTMYKYVKREEVEGDDLLPTSRGFCVQLVESGKLFSRQDINSMSTIFQYDIMAHTGGFWKDSMTGITYNHCRHYFKALSVIKKIK
ncbi:hypothetical protein [Pedobacter sp. L105]|uniref:hypothetical protein n=1 Tax=Pedobacter sp. L105 TaxID=1641871 RepID=UPI00131EC337|nr:hypothetical protein [Pedobacter sp. L105]